MKATTFVEPVIYLLVILFCVAVLVMVVISPADFLNISAVYQGF